MARAAKKEPPDDTRTPAEALQWADAPWLGAAKTQLRSARREGRLPHAILLHGAQGGGQSALAVWVAQWVLCQHPGDGPCGACGSCVLFLAGNHPDFHAIAIEEKATYIKVDQVRELCSKLAMRSYRGGSKIGLIDPADRMNTSSNNALLKTLEEPSEDTVLLLAASRIDRLARTVVSRCQRIRVVPPATPEAISWLSNLEARDDWPEMLTLAGGAPLLALELAGSGAGELVRDMAGSMPGPGARPFDPLGLADSWSKDRPAERLAWLEVLLQAWIRDAASVSDAVNNNRHNALPSLPAKLNMKTAFELLDRVREARGLQEGSLNTLLLFEDLLVGFAEAFAGGRAARPEIQG